MGETCDAATLERTMPGFCLSWARIKTVEMKAGNARTIASSAGVDQSFLGAFLCTCLPSFPNSRSRESTADPAVAEEPQPETSATDLALPPYYTGPALDPEKNPLGLLVSGPSALSSAAARNAVLDVNFLQYSPPAVEPPPYYPGLHQLLQQHHKKQPSVCKKEPPFPVSFPVRKRSRRHSKPPVYVDRRSHSRVQSLSYLSFPPPSYEMATQGNPTMPKVTTPPSMPTSTLPAGPRPVVGAGGGGAQSKDDILADLRRQLDDSVSDLGSSSIDSRTGRRRNRRRGNSKALAATNNNTAGGLTQPAILPRLAETKPVRLQLGLNLDVELELKARLQGDVSLTLLIEKKPSARPSEELKPSLTGVVQAAELFYMRIGALRLRQRWIEREVSASLTAAVGLGIAAGGFLAGFLVALVWCGGGGGGGGAGVVGAGSRVIVLS